MAREVRRLWQAEATGELAALRRLDPNDPIEPALFRLLADTVPEKLMGRALPEPGATGSRLDMTRRWALVAFILAQRPDALRGRLGEALDKAGISPGRLSMLLSARGPTFRDLVKRTARRLARATEVTGLPYREIGALVLIDGRPDWDVEADDIRVRIAADYQRAATKQAAEDTDASEITREDHDLDHRITLPADPHARLLSCNAAQPRR